MDFPSLFLYSLGFVVLLIATQDVHFFPGAVSSKLQYPLQRRKRVPREAESIFVETPDGGRLELWRCAPSDSASAIPLVAIIFHGNGGPVENFFFVQLWLSDMGIPSYCFDYRGFGRSSGWPSETRMYPDGNLVWEFVRRREGIDAAHLLVIGISIGSAPAARISALQNPKLLLLVSPFTDLRSTVRAQFLLGWLAPFVRYRFPTLEFVKELRETDLLLAHGQNDQIVPTSHAKILEEAYGGSGRVRRFSSAVAGHNLALYALKDELRDAILDWTGSAPE